MLKKYGARYSTHIRDEGNRVLGACVRDLRLFSLEQAVHKMTGGSATYEKPHQYATGVSTVVVNGEVVIDGGDHTGLLPGRVIRRPALH